MRCLTAFLFLDIRKTHWRSAVDLIDARLQKATAKVWHTLIALGELVAFHDPFYFEGHNARAIWFTILTKRLVKTHGIRIGNLFRFTEPKLCKTVLKTNEERN